MFSSGIFMVSGLRPLILVEVIFVHEVRKCSNLIVSHVPVFSASPIEETG